MLQAKVDPEKNVSVQRADARHQRSTTHPHVLTYALQVGDDRDLQTFQRIGRADSRYHQQLG